MQIWVSMFFKIWLFFCSKSLARDDCCIGGFWLAGPNRHCNNSPASFPTSPLASSNGILEKPGYVTITNWGFSSIQVSSIQLLKSSSIWVVKLLWPHEGWRSRSWISTMFLFFSLWDTTPISLANNQSSERSFLWCTQERTSPIWQSTGCYSNHPQMVPQMVGLLLGSATPYYIKIIKDQ